MSMPQDNPEILKTPDPEHLMRAAGELAAFALSAADPEERKDLLDTFADTVEDAGVAQVDVSLEDELTGEDEQNGSSSVETLTRQQRLRRLEIIDQHNPTSIHRAISRRSGGLVVDIAVRGAERGRKTRTKK